jgi:TRAP-type mannitol/chloroaromatic compound transport system substrate-binding protein
MGFGTSYFWKGKEPAAQFITGMPFGLTAQEQNGWFVSGGNELCQKVYDRLNVKFFVAGNSGAQMGGWFNKEITGPGDFNGLKMRMPGLGGEVLSAIGGTIVNLPPGELLQALQTGAIDALEWIGPSSDLAFGFYKVAKYYYYPGWQEPSGIFDCFINMDEWNKLEPDLQAIIETATQVSNSYVLNELMARNPAALRTLVDDHKVELKRFGDDTLIKLAEASGEVINDIASKDPLSRELLDSILKYRADVMRTTDVGEQAVLMARSLDYKFAQPN